MAGLLDDFLNSDQTRLGLGLLAAAGPRADGAGFGQRLMEGVGSMDQYKQDKLRTEFVKSQMADQAAQAEMRRMKAAQEQAAMEQAARKQAALPSLFSAGSAGAEPLNVDSMLPPEMRTGMAPQAAVAPRPAGVDVQRALAAGYTPEEIQKLDALRNIGQNEVARTVKGIGPDGREYETQLDKFGRPVGQGFAQWKAPILNDGGGQTNVLDPYNPLKPLGSIQKTMTFADKNAAGNLALSREKFAFDKAGGVDKAKGQVVDGQFIFQPDAQNPNGRAIPIAGFQKGLDVSQKKTLSGVESLNGAIGEYLNEMKGWSAKDALSPDKRASMGTKYNNMMLQAKEAYNLGVLNGPDFDILQSVVTDPRSITGAFTSNAALEKQAKELSRIMSTKTAPAVRDSGALAEKTDVNNTQEKKSSSVVDSLPKTAPKGAKARDTTTGQILVFDGLQWKPQ